jgi:hypothetical protein
MKRKCKNCGRELSIAREGMCSVCAKAAKGLTGEALDKALAAIKQKINAGEVRHNVFGRLHHPAPVPPAPAPSVMVRTPAGDATDIPVTIRLMVEICVRVTGVSAC